jgi:hypothetical protein
MWYTGGSFASWQIGYATSEDGNTWTKYANNPVLNKGSAGSWDRTFVIGSSVISDSAESKYKMWYSGGMQEGFITGSIGYAESDDFVGIENTCPSELSIYPNPSSSLITIETDRPDYHSIEIVSLSGQLIYRTEMKGGSKQIDLTPFSKGMYFVTVRSKEFVRTEKVVKL